MTSEAVAPNAHTRRAARTREAIVDGLIELIMAGHLEPTAQQVADAATVSVRTVYGHFKRLGDLHQAAIGKVTEMVLERVDPIDPAEALGVRIDLLCGQRSRINEDLGPLLRAAASNRHTSAELVATRQVSRDASREQIRRVFEAELDGLDPGARTRRVAAVDSLLSLGSWSSLRHVHELSPDQARIATMEALTCLLRLPPQPAP